MAFTELDDDTLRERIAAIGAHGSKRAAARALGIDKKTLDNSLAKAAKRGLMGFAPTLPGFEISRITNTPKGDFIQQRPERPDEEFVMPEGMRLDRATYQVAGGKLERAWLKPKQDNGYLLEDAIKAVFEAYPGTAELPAPKGRTSDDLLVIYPIADLHLGMFAWAKETGTDYDLKISADTLIESMSDLVARSAPATEALVLDMGDYFHADNSRNQTARSGNSLDVDTRYSKVVEVGVDLTVHAIELALQKHKQVRYRKLPGNHDDETSLMLAVAIAAHFRNNPRVTVDKSPSRFFMHQHGKCLVAATHGDMLKMGDLAGFTAAQWPKEWGETVFRYGYTGHVHNEKALAVNTLRGMRAESFNTLAAKDAWHASMGYQAPRNMVSITLHREKGETDRLTVAA